MGDIAASKICHASLENQSCHVGEGSLSSPGDAEGRNKPTLDLKLGISNTCSAKTSVNGSSTTHGAGVNFNTNQVHQRQASKPGLVLKLVTEKEDLKRLNRIMSNRASSEKYRTKRMIYMNQLEKQTSALQQQSSHIRQQFEETKNLHQSLLIEQHQLKLQIAAFEKERIVKEAEIEQNMAEVNRLRELQINQLQANQHAMPNSDGGSNAIDALHDELDPNF